MSSLRATLLRCWWQKKVRSAATFLLAISVFMVPAASQAQPDWDVIKKSVVRIHVTGQDRISGQTIDNWGTGFFVSGDGALLTAFHVIGRRSTGDKIDWGKVEGTDGRKITIEEYGNHGLLTPSHASLMVLSEDEVLDIAVLRASGNEYRAVTCRTDRVSESSNAWGIGWQQGKQSYDHLGPGFVSAFDAGDGERYRLVSMSAYKGNSGGPVFDENGQVVGVITSGRDQVLRPGGNETFATPLSSLIAPLLNYGPCSSSRSVDTTTGPLLLPVAISDEQGNASDAEIFGHWDELPEAKLVTTKQSDGRYRIAIERVAQAKTFLLTFRQQGFQQESVSVRLTQGGVFLPSALNLVLRPFTRPSPQVGDNEGSQDGRTLYFFPYTLLDPRLTGAIGQHINENMPFHIRYGIVAKLPFYNRDISVEDLQKNNNLAPLVQGMTAANAERFRKIGKRLNALGVITGLAGPHGGQGSDSEIDVLSTYLLPADATEILPAEVTVEDVVHPQELDSPVFGQNLSRAWALRTIVALAEKESRTSTNSTSQILAYLQKARQIAVNEEERKWVDALVARLQGHTQ